VFMRYRLAIWPKPTDRRESLSAVSLKSCMCQLTESTDKMAHMVIVVRDSDVESLNRSRSCALELQSE
jgi:hypothetical protein